MLVLFAALHPRSAEVAVCGLRPSRNGAMTEIYPIIRKILGFF